MDRATKEALALFAGILLGTLTAIALGYWLLSAH